MNNSQVAHAWAHGRRGKGSHFESDGVTLTSYWTTVAARIDDVIYISADNMSPSTSRHLSYARQAVNHERDKIFYTHAFSWGHHPMLEHYFMIQPEAEHAIKTLETALAQTRTRQATKNAACIEYMQRRQQIMELATRYSVTLPDMPEISADKITECQEQQRQAEERKEAARIAAVKKQQDDDRIAFTFWLIDGAGTCPRSYHRHEGTDWITIKGDKVVTSQGAECPLDHAVKALKFWESRKMYVCSECGYVGAFWTDHIKNCLGALRHRGEFYTYKTNGHKIPLGIFTLDSIDEQGNVKAGCHTFTRAEIERFINQWREVLGL